MHYRRPGIVFVALVSIVIVAFSGGSDSRKAAGKGSKNPFAAKKERQHIPQNEEGVAFQREIQLLSSRIAQFRVARASEALVGRLSTQYHAAQLLSQVNGGPVQIHWDENGTLPIFIKGKHLQRGSPDVLGKMSSSDFELLAMRFLDENAALLQIENPSTEFIRTELVQDELGFIHVRFQQVYQGIEIWGRDVRVHLTSDGNVESFNGRYVRTPKALVTDKALVDDQSAREIALQDFGRSSEEISSRKLIYDDAGQPHLCWEVNVRKGLTENWFYFIDANTGRVWKRYNHVMSDGPVSGSGVDLFNQVRALDVYQIGTTYYMINAAKSMFNPAQSTFPDDGKGVIYTFDAKNAEGNLYFVTSTDPNSWNNQPAVSAAYHGAKVYDYYKAIHNRDAIDGSGSTMNVVVKFKVNYNNAFWNGQFMVFGSGDNNQFSDLAGALDVTAHEMTHGVVERTANLVYETQAGALNESFADVFGVLFEFWVEGASGDWLLGEDVTTPGTAGDCLRNMTDPAASNVAFGGQQPGHMNDYRNLPNTSEGDNGGVHINSGIPNKAFYLFATSSGVTKEEAGQVYYRALSNYLTRNSQFVDCRLAVIRAAEDLFGGPGNAKATAAAAAFDAVGMVAGSGTPEPPPADPVQGTSYLAVIEATSGFLYRTSPTGQNITQITATPLFSRPSATDDGSFIFYVDNTNNLHLLRLSDLADQALSTSGGFNNVSVSPDGRYLAVTSVFGEAIMYIFDLVDQAGDKQIQLYTPTYTQGENAGNILFPDRIDWASDSEILMYDAFNIAVSATGDTIGYWDINIVRTTDGAISRLFPPQPPGVNIGNSVFSSNSDNVIAFDYVDENGQVQVVGVNLNQGTTGMITNNFSSLGSPSFSNDDRKVFYHYIDQNSIGVWVVDLQADGITGVGNDQGIINGAVYPVSFTVGTRPTPVEDDDRALPASFALKQNYPNPFNPATVIEYELPHTSRVRLTVYDALGQQIRTLTDADQGAGYHRVQWDGAHDAGVRVSSGVYFYRLVASGSDGQPFVFTRKMVLLK